MAKLSHFKKFLIWVCFAQLLACSESTEPLSDGGLLISTDWRAAYTLESVDCWFEIDWTQSVACAQLKTDPASGQFSLPVVVLKNTSPVHFPEPLLYLSGGPGGSGNIRKNDMAHWVSWYEQADLKRDLILVDRRGTGGSEPRHNCDAYERFSRKILRENASLARELTEGLAVTKNCLPPLNTEKSFKHSGENFTPKDYGSHHSARDMVALMAALGYERWNIFAVSYGTRLALRILQMKEAGAVDSLVLDSFYPLDKGALKEWPALLDKALTQLFNINGPNEAASIEADFWLALDALKARTMRFSVPSWNGEAPFTVVLNDHRFLSMVFASSYDRTTLVQIPALVQAVLEGEHLGVQPLLNPFINYAFDPQFNPMVFFALECLESPVLNKAEYVKEAARFPKLLSYTQPLADYDICAYLPSWSEFERAAILSLPVLEKPILLLSGGLDPITPIQWAEEFVRERPTIIHRAFPELGHSMVGSSACAHSLLGPFLRAVNDDDFSTFSQEKCDSAQ